MRPVFGRHHRGRVRGVLQRVVVAVDPALLYRADLRADRDHCLDEAVELDLGLALGRLDHQRAGHRERERRRVETVVHQTLGNILGADSARIFQRSEVEDALVRNEAVAARVQRREVRRKTLGDVIRVQ